jgi:hypothetical protein
MSDLEYYHPGGTMPKVDLTPTIEGLSGSLRKDDEFTFRRTRKGKRGRTIMIKKADMSNVEWSPAQKATRGHFGEAVAFAQSVLADPELKKAYNKRARRKGTDAYHLAISEYNKVPGKRKSSQSGR